MTRLENSLIELATSQHGMLTTQQLRKAGKSPADLVALVASAVLTHPGRGLYSVADQVAEDPTERHRQLVAGAFLLYPDAVLTGTSTVLSHELPTWDTPLGTPRLLRPRNRSGGMKAFSIRRVLNRPEAVEGPWGPSVPLADALAQHAIDNGAVQGVISLDQALRLGHVTTAEMAEVAQRVASWPGSSRVRAMNDLADGRRESVGESRTGVTLSFLGFEVVPQVEIFDRGGYFVARVDFLIKGTRVIIEFDGKLKYLDADKKDEGNGKDPTRKLDVLFDEKRREDRLRELGYFVVRLVWSDLSHPARIAAKIRAALALAV